MELSQRLTADQARNTEIAHLRALAAALVEQALDEVDDKRPEVADDARLFLTVSLWDVDAPWATLLGLDKAQFLAALARRVAA